MRRVRAAVSARRDGDFVVMACTDARAVEGFGAAVDRAKAFAETRWITVRGSQARYPF